MKAEKRLQLIAIGLLLTSLVAAIFYYKHQARKFQDMTQLQAVELSTLQDSVRIIKQKNGDLNFQVQTVEVEKRNLKESLQIAGYEIKDLKEKEIRWRKLNSVLNAELESKGSGETEIKHDTVIVNQTDTIIKGNFAWNNNFLELDGNIKENLISFDYRYNTPIDIFTSEKKKETIITVSLADPNASIISANSITVFHEKRFWEKPWIWGLAGFTTGIIISR
jgi:hypothetical protein